VRGEQYLALPFRESPVGERGLEVGGEIPSASSNIVIGDIAPGGAAFAVREPDRPLPRTNKTAFCGESRWHHEQLLVLLTRGCFN